MDVAFEDFFQGVWGVDPFPWQRALAARVVERGWPELLDLPTGAGKTAAIDIALWSLAQDGGAALPRRIVLVVDRRIIVDQVGERARRLHEALETGGNTAVQRVAEALRAMTGAEAPLLETAVLRGASVRDDAWARHPHVPVVAASTVDQVGSRLLFRGYGVSPSMAPIHAGLLGCDTLLLLDEVHLSRAFADFLRQLEVLRGEAHEDVPRRFRVVEMSATAGSIPRDAFKLTTADRSDPVLAPRLTASR